MDFTSFRSRCIKLIRSLISLKKHVSLRIYDKYASLHAFLSLFISRQKLVDQFFLLFKRFIA